MVGWRQRLATAASDDFNAAINEDLFGPGQTEPGGGSITVGVSLLEPP